MNIPNLASLYQAVRSSSSTDGKPKRGESDRALAPRTPRRICRRLRIEACIADHPSVSPLVSQEITAGMPVSKRRGKLYGRLPFLPNHEALTVAEDALSAVPKGI